MKMNLLEKVTERVLVTPEATVVVIDFDRLEREVLKGAIQDSDVQKLLPFKTKRVNGLNHVHIQNESAYTIETNAHFVREGDTLCMRQGLTSPAGRKGIEPTCPGCLAKAKTIIVNHLLTQELI